MTWEIFFQPFLLLIIGAGLTYVVGTRIPQKYQEKQRQIEREREEKQRQIEREREDNKYKKEIKKEIIGSYNNSVRFAYIQQYNIIRELGRYYRIYDVVDCVLDEKFEYKNPQGKKIEWEGDPQIIFDEVYKQFKESLDGVRHNIQKLHSNVRLYSGDQLVEELEEYARRSVKITNLISEILFTVNEKDFIKYRNIAKEKLRKNRLWIKEHEEQILKMEIDLDAKRA